MFIIEERFDRARAQGLAAIDAAETRAASALRNEVADSIPLLGWAFTGVDPGTPQRWNQTSERNARRWAGPGMLANMCDDAVGTWEGFDHVLGETTPRSRTYLELLPDIDDIVADLASSH